MGKVVVDNVVELSKKAYRTQCADLHRKAAEALRASMSARFMNDRDMVKCFMEIRKHEKEAFLLEVVDKSGIHHPARML